MSVDAVVGFRDKGVLKERVAGAGLPVPRSARARTRTDIVRFADEVGFPIVVKPTAGAASADTWRAGDAAELAAVLDRVRHVQECAVEEFVTGDEYTFETLCIEGRPVFTSIAFYVPNVLVARQNEWVSPIILALRNPEAPDVIAGQTLGRHVLAALGMGTGFTHMEWFRRRDGSAVFGEVACRPPGAAMVDLMNFANDVDLFREWARVVVHGRFEAVVTRPWNAATVFKRARGRGRITRVVGLETFLRRHGPHVAHVDLLPIGAPRRDWTRTFLSDGHLDVRHPDYDTCLAIAREAAADIHLEAG
jgi:biotin carboxylase